MGVNRVISADWPAPPGIVAVSTTREHGVSEGPYASFNLATHVGDEPAQVAENRRLLRQRLALPEAPRWLQQVHGTDVATADSVLEPVAADAAYSASVGVVCAVLTADCLPVLFCDSRGQQVAAAHAGWAGLVAGVLEQTCDRFSAGSELLAWLGPAISQPRFEVGAEVRERYLQAAAPGWVDRTAAAFVPSHRPDHWLADLYALARIRLQRLGVRCWGGDYCTATDAQRFYSYRRDGITGRMATLIYRRG